ncbi:MAG: L,D-transpeptidase family protein [Planctomycetota bacterium]
MALPSQSGRPQQSRRVTTYSRRKKSGPPLVVVLLLVVGGLVVVGAVAARMLPGGGADEAVAETAGDGPGDGDSLFAQRETGEDRGAGEPTAIPAPVEDRGAASADAALDAIFSGAAQPDGGDGPTRGLLSGAMDDAATGDDNTPRTGASTMTEVTPTPEAPRTASAAAWEQLLAQGREVAAREAMSARLHESGTPELEKQRLRARLSELNEELVFGRQVEPSDPITEWYQVQSGDTLGRIAARRELLTEWKLIQRVNGLSDPRRIRVGQRLKLVRGPFHAIVHKGDYRLDLYHGPPSEPERWVFVRSFEVGLGEGGSTPVGSFVVASNKLENPGWVNPRNSRERYDRDDPANPIGEFWIGLEGLGDDAIHRGYGIHGTIEPGSIGRSESMGCVRLSDGDVALVFELLAEGTSVVHILD